MYCLVIAHKNDGEPDSITLKFTQYVLVTCHHFFRIIVHVILGPLRVQWGLLFTICVDASSPRQAWQALIDMWLFTY